MHEDQAVLSKAAFVGERLPGLLQGNVALPAAVLLDSAMRHNLAWMQRFVDAYGLQLAPHGKTTMAPALFRRQVAGGAWGITVATVQQAWVAATHGIARVLIANQVVGQANIDMLAMLVERGTDVLCLVDSPDGVAQLSAGMAARDVRIDVLIELAPTRDQSGSRTGVRDDEQLVATLAAIAEAPGLRLAGVEVYEGVLADEAEIRRYLQRAVAVTGDLARAGAFDRSPAILTGAGSAWYDVVADVFAGLDPALDVAVLLRPGCYLSHDAGLYRTAQAAILARNPIAAEMRGGLIPALQIWAAVQSRPDPDRAVVAMGKRDVAFDAGLPMPRLWYRPGLHDRPVAAPAGWAVEKLMDQHAYLRCAAGDDVAVGDLIGFDVSHPCLTFDKWRSVLIVDDEYRVIERIETFF